MTSRPTRVIAMFAVLAGAVAACGSDSEPEANAEVPDAIDDDASATDVATVAAQTATTAASTSPVTTVPPTTAPPTVPTTLAPTTTLPVFPPNPRVLLIGDSTLLAVEEYERLDVLRGMDAVYEAKSCRLLGIPSCGKNPAPNAVAVLDSSEGAFDMVVVMAGYDEWFDTFSTSFDQVVTSARAKGAKRIVWLSYPENVDYRIPDGRAGNDSLVMINQIMRDKVASGGFPDVVIADWYTYASQAEGWWADDDIHLTPTGASAVADYISRKVAFIAGLPCAMPREPGAAVEAPCPDPDLVGPVRDVVELYELAG